VRTRTWLRSSAALSLATALLHLDVVGEHFREYRPAGEFFAVVAALEAAWAVAIVARPNRGALLAGVTLNLALLSLWGLSRTLGVPVGPAPWVPEPVGALDLACAGLEAVSAAMCAALLHAAGIHARMWRWSSGSWGHYRSRTATG
jgi:hypothetical protein